MSGNNINNRKRQKRGQEVPESVSGMSLCSTTNINRRLRCATTNGVATRRAAHIVCAVSENLAKETCVASLDATTPVHLQVTKQGNGLTYAETLAFLEVLGPHEVLMNEGRSGSTLARKIMQLFNTPGEEQQDNSNNERRSHTDDSHDKSAPVVKFISRVCFDQTKGSELLARVAREETYDASIFCEYILLSSAHAVLHHTQQNLGATFAKRSLYLEVNSGGTSKMAIDRYTMLQLELLQNAKSGKTRSSLIATIDYTKTSVGNRLLRSNLMNPPARLDTIMSRLDLVEVFLASEDWFYTVMGLLRALPCLDKMLTNVALVPPKGSRKKSNAAVATEVGLEVTKKDARKGISALVGIKTTLAALPAFTRALEDRLNELDSQHTDRRSSAGSDDASTIKSSLLLGLGGGAAIQGESSPAASFATGHHPCHEESGLGGHFRRGFQGRHQ